jgi:arsenite-transporting ATPase
MIYSHRRVVAAAWQPFFAAEDGTLRVRGPVLFELTDNEDSMRIVLYTGKGGVGKTSMSAATAIRAAELGYRTVVVSTDPAHSLGDSFDRPIGSELVQLAPNLWGQEIDLLNQMDKYWGRVQGYLNALFAWRGMDELVAEETSVLPGMEELACLMQITYLADSGNYDVIVIDAAPTGSTLQLLSFPDMARWYIEKIFPFQRTTVQIARPLMKRFSDMPMPDDDIFASIEDLVGTLARTSELLSNPTVASMRVVLNPEKMVVKEAQRAYTYLSLYGYPVDAVICNRVFPKQLEDNYFDIWKSAQTDNLALVQEAFQPLPIFEVPFFRQEVTGMEMLKLMASTVFGETAVRGGEGDPTRYFYSGKAQEIFRQNGHYVLSLPLPLVDREQVHLHRSVFDELVVRIGNWKRNVSLPLGLARLEIEGAKYVDDRLNILFTIPESGQTLPPEELKPNAWQSLKARLGGK